MSINSQKVSQAVGHKNSTKSLMNHSINITYKNQKPYTESESSFAALNT